MNIDPKLRLKIQKGTRSGKRLCDSCAYGHIVRGEAESEEIIRCTYADAQIPIKVVECNTYQDKTVPSLGDMKSIAWMVRTDQTGHKIGFVSPEKWRALVRSKEIVDDDDE